MEDSFDKFNGIKTWAEDDRPREKFLLKGKHSLSNAELLAILIGTGTRNESAVDLGRKILQLTAENLNELAKLSINDLTKVKGIGQAKAITIAAALELGRRRKEENAKEIEIVKTSREAFNYFEPMVADLPHEEFWILLLARNRKVLSKKQISAGGVAGTVVDMKIIFKHAIENLASYIVLCHNHPSGNLTPSSADIQITKALKNGGKLLEIEIVDHIIIGGDKYYSFADNDEL
ncbi:MAG: RadC family protein [Bacteroidia bacterium]